MPAARVLAQAKINLFLRVLAREATGYHRIETLFCRLALGDAILVRTTPGTRSVAVIGDRVPAAGLGPAEENLAWRAANEYIRHAGWPAGFAIEIEKRIPVGAGLGGGSADAGAVLRALNELNPAPLSGPALLAVAGSLGSDVPFLTQDRASLALGWGRGERLLALPPLPSRVCWLFSPGVSVVTRDAYRWLSERAPSHQPAMLDLESLRHWPGVAAAAHNDFEDVVSEQLPGLKAALGGLREPDARRLFGPDPIIQMSGSGSTLFVITGNPSVDLGAWNGDLPGFAVMSTRTADAVEPVVRVE